MKNNFTIGHLPLTLADLGMLVKQPVPVQLSLEVQEKITHGRLCVENLLHSGRAIYGVNTGFGALAEVRIDDDQLKELQRRLIVSHAAGVGAPLSVQEVRALIVLRAQVLSTGHAGVRLEVVQRLLDLYRYDILPIIPEKGSVGASGDLAPLAHLALALLGEGDVWHQGQIKTAKEALISCGLSPLVLEAKEGLALVNGTQAMSAVGGLALLNAQHLALCADVIGALSVEGMMASHTPFDARIANVRPHPGHINVAKRLRLLLEDSQIMRAHAQCNKVQDAYSFRCMPQVHGATQDALNYVSGVLNTEINAATDNPLVFSDDQVLLSGGNFHGQPVALALDFAAIALAELANISERRIEQLLNPNLSGLQAFLTQAPGQNSGYMMAQVTAASLVNENKMLAYPSSVDSIPTSASREDHVSMGMTSARKLRQIAENVSFVLAIELLCAAQALDLRRPLRPAKRVGEFHHAFRQCIPMLEADRFLSLDIKRAQAWLCDYPITSFLAPSEF